jgi:membrane-associated protease RseP (regulator of RpoE activity)
VLPTLQARTIPGWGVVLHVNPPVTETLRRRAFLGAELPGDAEAFIGGGVNITAVAPSSMAEQAGMRGGDRLLALAGLPVRDLRELSAALRQAARETTTELV